MRPLCRVEGAVSSLRRTVILDTESDAGLFDKISISNQMHWSVLDDAIAELSPDESARASRLTIFFMELLQYRQPDTRREDMPNPPGQDQDHLNKLTTQDHGYWPKWKKLGWTTMWTWQVIFKAQDFKPFFRPQPQPQCTESSWPWFVIVRNLPAWCNVLYLWKAPCPTSLRHNLSFTLLAFPSQVCAIGFVIRCSLPLHSLTLKHNDQPNNF